MINEVNKAENSHSILVFLTKIKEDIGEIIGSKLSDNDLSYYLGQNNKYITYLKKNVKRNPNFLLSLEELQEFKSSLKKILGKNSKFIISNIRSYIKSAKLKLGKGKIYDYHPIFVINYFQEINNKDKAYWLGFIFADGSISYKKGGRGYKNPKYKSSLNLRLRFGLKADDPQSVERVNSFADTLGLSRKYVKILSNGLYGFEIINDSFCKHLIDKGVIVGYRKTYSIELPNLNERKLYLAFLLGYFDGDGKRRSTRITSSSFRFLEQIKRRFNLPFKISLEKGTSAYNFHLGADLFNEMLRNYTYSMPRKRHFFITPDELKQRNTKFKISRQILMELQRLILIYPLKDLALYFGVSASRLGKLCDKHKMIKPTRGYWHRDKKIGINHLFWEHF